MIRYLEVSLVGWILQELESFWTEIENCLSEVFPAKEYEGILKKTQTKR